MTRVIMQDDQDMLKRSGSLPDDADEASLLAVVKTFLEGRGWTVTPGRCDREGSLTDRNERVLSKAAVKFAVAMPGYKPARHRRAVDLVERTLIAFAMQHHEGNQSAAAEYLGMHRNTLRKKLRELNVQGSDEIGEYEK